MMMDYTYIPDSFNYKYIKERFDQKNSFLDLQIKYKMGFEKFLLSHLDMEKISRELVSVGFAIPKIEDTTANFYRKFSQLGNPYIYIRNNYHVERLTDEELAILNSNPTSEFFSKTFPKVMFEDGKTVFYGIPRVETECDAKSITFEFAFDKVACQTMEEIISIEDAIERCKAAIKAQLQDRYGLPISFVVYTGIPKLFPKDAIDKII